MSVEKYWLFAGDNYYPSQGLGDFRGSFDTVDDAMKRFTSHYAQYDWAFVALVVNNDLHIATRIK
jgi:hypothetical protein